MQQKRKKQHFFFYPLICPHSYICDGPGRALAFSHWAIKGAISKMLSLIPRMLKTDTMDLHSRSVFVDPEMRHHNQLSNSWAVKITNDEPLTTQRCSCQFCTLPGCLGFLADSPLLQQSITLLLCLQQPQALIFRKQSGINLLYMPHTQPKMAAKLSWSRKSI